MKSIFVPILAIAIVSTSANAAAVPAKYSNHFTKMALAAVASQMCSGLSLNQAQFDAQAKAFRSSATADGYSVDQTDQMWQSVESNPQIISNGMARYAESKGIGANDISGFCGAMKQEKAAGTMIGSMLK